MSFFSKFSFSKSKSKSKDPKEQPSSSKKKGSSSKKRISSEISIPQSVNENQNTLFQTSRSWDVEASRRVDMETFQITNKDPSRLGTNISLSAYTPISTGIAVDVVDKVSANLEILPKLPPPQIQSCSGSAELSPVEVRPSEEKNQPEMNSSPQISSLNEMKTFQDLKREPLQRDTPTSAGYRTLRTETNVVDAGQNISASPQQRRRQPSKPQSSLNLLDYESDNSEVNFSVGVVSITRTDPTLTTPKGAYIHGMLGGPKSRPDLEDALYAPSSTLSKRGGNKSSSSSFSLDMHETTPANVKAHAGDNSTDDEMTPTKSKVKFSHGVPQHPPRQKTLKLNRQLEKECHARELMELQYEQMKQMHHTLESRMDHLLTQNRKLQEKREELDSRVNALKFEIANQEDKRRSAERTLGRVKDLLRKKEDELLRAQEHRQRSEQELQARDMEYHALSHNVKELEEQRDDYSQRLRELLNEYSPMESSSQLQRSLPNLEHKVGNEQQVLMLKSAFFKSNADSFESVNQDLMGLKAELDRSRSRLREDRLKWLELNQQLQQRVDALSEQLDLREEALSTASLQYTIHINQIKAEMAAQRNTALRQEEIKMDLEREVRDFRECNDDLQNQLSAIQEYFSKDPEKFRGIEMEIFANPKAHVHEKELREMRDLNRILSEKVSKAENRLHILEVELMNADEKLRSKHRETENSQFTVGQLREQMEKWREKAHDLEVEREGLYAQVDGLTERLEDFRSNNQRLQKHLDNITQVVKTSQDDQPVPFITKEMFEIVRQNQKLLDAVTSLLPPIPRERRRESVASRTLSMQHIQSNYNERDGNDEVYELSTQFERNQQYSSKQSLNEPSPDVLRGRRARFYSQGMLNQTVDPHMRRGGSYAERARGRDYYIDGPNDAIGGHDSRNLSQEERRPSLEGLSGSKNKLMTDSDMIDGSIDPQERSMLLNRLELLEKETIHSEEKLKNLRQRSIKDRLGYPGVTRMKAEGREKWMEYEKESDQWDLDNVYYLASPRDNYHSNVGHEHKRREKERSDMHLKVPSRFSQSYQTKPSPLQHSISSQNVGSDPFLDKSNNSFVKPYQSQVSPTTPTWNARPNSIPQTSPFQPRQNSQNHFNFTRPQMDLLQNKLKNELNRSISRHLEAGQVTPPRRGNSSLYRDEPSPKQIGPSNSSTATLAPTGSFGGNFPSSQQRESPIGGASTSSTLQFHESEQEIMYKASPPSNSAAAAYRQNKYLL